MTIEGRVSEAGQIGDEPTAPMFVPEVISALKLAQEESLRILGEKVGFAVEELTGIAVFKPEPKTDLPTSNQGWNAEVLSANRHYDFRHVKLSRKLPDGITQIIMASYGSLIGLSIQGEQRELDEIDYGNYCPKTSSREEIEQAFSRAILNPWVITNRK